MKCDRCGKEEAVYFIQHAEEPQDPGYICCGECIDYVDVVTYLGNCVISKLTDYCPV